MLRYTNVNLELIQDPEMYEFLENGLRGGCSTIYHRLWTSNSEELGDLFDSRVEGSTIKYLGKIYLSRTHTLPNFTYKSNKKRFT